MNMRTIFYALALALAATIPAAAGSPKTPAGWHSGVAISTLADPFAAADEAAGKAKAKLGGVPAKLVLAAAAEAQVTPEFVEGLKKHFPAGILYGCQVASPLATETNFPDFETIDIPAGVEVWALGGDVEIVAETVATDTDEDNPYETAGLKLGEALRPAVEASKRPGKLIIAFGDQFTGSNQDFANGLNEGLGRIYPVIGGAAGNITAKEIVRGEIVAGANVGILLAGDFRVGQARNGGTHTPETADRTLAYAVEQGGGKDPFFALIFNCRRRRQGMIERKQLGEELEAIRKNLPATEFFGFYGPGEIGADKPGQPAFGTGFTVAVAVLFAE